MNKEERGKVLIINVEKVRGSPARTGTNVDRDNLTLLFEQLHMTVTAYNDGDGLTAAVSVSHDRDTWCSWEHLPCRADVVTCQAKMVRTCLHLNLSLRSFSYFSLLDCYIPVISLCCIGL